MDEITVTSTTDFKEPERTLDVSRQVVFETEDTMMVQSRVAAGVTTGWHHNGNRHVFGYVVQGHAELEYGQHGKNAVDLATGDCVYVPPRTIRRVVNRTDEDWVIVISFVGAGPPAVSVEGPQAENE